MLDLAPAVAAVRSFNRAYTKVIGLLDEGLVKSPYTLTEVRVLFEIAHSGPDGASVARIREDLGLDAGYLSRILARFDEEGMVVKGRAADDARRGTVTLTERGRSVFSGLEDRSSEQVAALLSRLGAEDRGRLVEAMVQVGSLLGLDVATGSASEVTLRAPRAGDYGWAVERHGALYAAERGFDETFEADVARIVADYAASHDPERERFWIAEAGGRRVGCVACVRRAGEGGGDGRDGGDGLAGGVGETAQLRILLVEPSARGLGVGRRLVEECVDFARKAGYRRMVLFTVDGLTAAHRIYRDMGFEIVHQEAVQMWGHHLVEQEWAMELG
ncbi:MAG: MarR family transcriptional regulator [Catenulispora sp.]|nr:MarR family transcriptional regulator [Catenulispora sp.]